MPVTSNKLSVSILLPTYNEHDNLPIIVYLLAKELNKATDLIADFEIIIIDDNSPDGTGAVADRLAAPGTVGDLLNPEQVKVMKRAGKLGLGSAYVHGCARARFDYIVILDADLSHHPRAIRAMAQKMLSEPRLDIVTGSRYIAGGGVYGWDVKRRVVSRGANFLADYLLKPQVSDLTGSFRLYRKDAFLRLIRETITKGYTFQMEMMVRARKHGMRIAEVPITFVDRQFGESKLGSGEIVGYLRGLWQLFTTV